MYVRRVLLASLLFSCLFLTSCVKNTGSSNTPAPSYTAVDGNWHITGEQGTGPAGLPLAESPFLAFDLGVIGNTVYANGVVEVNCTTAAAEGNGLSLSSQIASDGTFTLSNSSVPLDSIQLTIQGKIPDTGATTWSGNYTVVNANPPTGCIFNDSNSFVATPYPPLDGTYAGTITGPGL